MDKSTVTWVMLFPTARINSPTDATSRASEHSTLIERSVWTELDRFRMSRMQFTVVQPRRWRHCVSRHSESKLCPSGFTSPWLRAGSYQLSTKFAWNTRISVNESKKLSIVRGESLEEPTEVMVSLSSLKRRYTGEFAS